MHVKQSVGEMVNKALAAIKEDNSESLSGVLKPINFVLTKGDKKRVLPDNKVVELINHFGSIRLTRRFRVPGLAWRRLRVPHQILRRLGWQERWRVLHAIAGGPLAWCSCWSHLEGTSVYDPTCGSGGMLIQSGQYVEEAGGNSQRMALYGQEMSGTTWAICKMNMILHGYRAADIRNEDVLANPQHITGGSLTRFKRVLANPPFSQNYAKAGMAFPERFHTFMPESGKKADLMFVQHIVASLEEDGKAAVVMPHGVLFRGGPEKEARRRIIEAGHLDAVIGLPPGLFYGTGIPACVLVLSKIGARDRKDVLFINADREYKEGKNQNSLRPEDIEKIAYVYHERLVVKGYSDRIPVADLATEDCNLNIRRYVDNSPPPEPAGCAGAHPWWAFR